MTQENELIETSLNEIYRKSVFNNIKQIWDLRR